MKTILITGGAGFIGSHLCKTYLEDGYKVIALDNLITGSLDNISPFFKLKNFDFYHQDVSKFTHIPEKIDYILHFASPASPIDYLKYPIQTLKVGALGTHNMLGLAKLKKATIMVASTSEIYGDPLEHPQKEEYWGNVNAIGPRGVYDEAKRFQEAITMAYHKTHGVDIRIVRIFNTYGPNMRTEDGRVLPTFICQALNQKSIPIFGNGKQTRSFCYISDLIRGIKKLLVSGYTQPINLGNPIEVEILKIAEEIIEMVQSSSKIIYNHLPEDDPKRRCPDITKAKKILQWEPEISRASGLIIALDYFKKKLNK